MATHPPAGDGPTLDRAAAARVLREALETALAERNA
jgi:hypothetical protein